MKIYLVRHAQSESNVDFKILRLQTNMSVKLSADGVKQAQETGAFLSNFIKEGKIKVWNSPYTRTRQTAQAIKDTLKTKREVFTEEESIYIAERQFGLVDDVEDYVGAYKNEAKHYKLHKDSQHDFFARPPLGESPFDMCMRLDFFIRSVLAQESDIEHHVIVSHGAAIRGFILMQQKQKYEEYNCPNPWNASIRLIDGDSYKGEIFKPSKVTS